MGVVECFVGEWTCSPNLEGVSDTCLDEYSEDPRLPVLAASMALRT